MKARLCFALAVALSACTVDNGVDPKDSDDPSADDDDNGSVVGDDDDDSSSPKGDDDDDDETGGESDTAPTWTTVKAPATCRLNVVWGAKSNDVWLGGITDTNANACIFRWDGSKLTQFKPWDPLHPPGEIGVIWGSGANDVWFLETPGGTAAATHWDGSTLSQTYALGGAMTIAGDGAGHVWAAGLAGEDYRWTGTKWFYEIGVIGSFVRAMASPATNDFWAGGETLWHYTNGSWNPVSSDFVTHDVVGIWGAAADDVWVIQNVNDGIAHFDGKEWESVKLSSKTIGLEAISGTSASDVWAVGGGRWHWNGKAWSKAHNALTKAVHAIAPNDVWVINQSGTIEHYH